MVSSAPVLWWNLANELAQKGIERGAAGRPAGRRARTSFLNDEWASFFQLSRLDGRTTSGSWRVARDFPGCRPRICKTVGGSTTHWAGASLRLQEHEFRRETV
jgi:hypothetical protein